MSTTENEQEVAVGWDYEKMTNGVNVKFPHLDSTMFWDSSLPREFYERLSQVWNKHSQEWDVFVKIEIIDHLYDPFVTDDHPQHITEHLLYPERSEFSAYVILKCLYPDDCDLPPHRFIRWERYPSIDWDSFESPVVQVNQCSVTDVDAVNEGVLSSVQDERDESLKTKNKVIIHNPWWNTKDAPLSPALDQQNDTTADGPSEDFVSPGSWVERSGWHYRAHLADGPPKSRSYAKPDSESGRSKEMAHQETSAEDDGVYDECTNFKFSKRSVQSACPSNNVFAAAASKFSSETEASEVGVFTPASSNVEQAPALSDQQMQELKGFITKTTNDAVTCLSLEMSHMKVAHLSLSLEMSHMKNSFDDKIDRMREDSNPKLNTTKRAERSLRGETESLQLFRPEIASTRQQLRELEAKVARLGESIATL